MKMSNIRPNFSNMPEEEQRGFFLNYATSREADFTNSLNVVVKPKKSASTKGSKTKEPTLSVSPAQLALLKALGIV